MKSFRSFVIFIVGIFSMSASLALINPKYEKFSKGHVPDKYRAIISEVAGKLGVEDFPLEVRVPNEAAYNISPEFKCVFTFLGSGYVYINPTWFDSLSADEQRFAVGEAMLNAIYPLRNWSGLVGGLIAGVAMDRVGCYFYPEMSRIQQLVLALLVASGTSFFGTRYFLYREYIKRTCRVIEILGVPAAAQEYQKKLIKAMMLEADSAYYFSESTAVIQRLWGKQEAVARMMLGKCSFLSRTWGYL